MTPSRSVFNLVWRTLLWALPCFIVWYRLGEVHTTLVGMAVKELVDASLPVKFQMWEHFSSLVFEMPFATGPAGAVPEFASAKVEIDVLAHGAGVPLFVALMLGTPDATGRDLSIPLGVAVLLAYETLAVYCFVILNALKILHVLGADTRMLFGLSWYPQIATLADALGKLVLPTLLAIVLWAVFNRRFIEESVICSK